MTTIKKILFLVTQSEFGGASKYIADLTLGIDKNKYLVEIAAGEPKKEAPNGWLKQLESKGFKIWRLKHVVREVNLWHDFLSGFELYALFLKSKPDIIHLNSSKIGSTGAVVGFLYKIFHPIKKKQLKIIYTAHGFVFNEPLTIFRQLFYRWSERISGWFKDKIICVSEQDKITGLNHKIANHNKFITIHNGIDLQELKFLEKDEARKVLDSRSICHWQIGTRGNDNKRGLCWIGTIANLYSTKGIIYLIRAAKIITNKMPDLKFVVIGEGGLRPVLEQEIKKLNLENNFFLIGSQPNASQFLKAFDIFCLPSIKEGFPYALLEAMAAGLPIITTPVGGVLEIVTNEINGFIVPKEKPREIARALEKILNSQELQKKFRQNNLEKIKQFSLRKMTEETIKVYEE